MLSPSDFNNAVPQFTNGNYASNPINPQYVEEPTSTDYNHGVEPLQTLPAQWWNWFLNKFTARFNKVNVYVKNIFNELTQLLSLFGMTPDGTEGTPTTEQLKTAFCSCYPAFVKSCITGAACGCIPTIGVAMGSTDGNIVATDASGNLKPTGITVGTAAGCDASCFLQAGCAVPMANAIYCRNSGGTEFSQCISECYVRISAGGGEGIDTVCISGDYYLCQRPIGGSEWNVTCCTGLSVSVRWADCTACASCANFATCANAIRIQPHSSCNSLICVKCQQWKSSTCELLACACAKTNLLLIRKDATAGCSNAVIYAKSGYVFSQSYCVCNKNSFNEACARKCYYTNYYFIQLSCVID